jgi:pilus assembly protein CpaC
MTKANRTVLRRAASALVYGVLFGAAAQQATATTFLRLYRDESKIIRVDGLKRVSVTNQSVATPVIISPSEIMVNGLQVGRTSMYIWDINGRTEIMVVVRPFTEELQKKLEDDIDNPKVNIQVFSEGSGDKVFLRGMVDTLSEFRFAETVAGAYLGDANVINLLEVKGVNEDPLSQLTRLIDNPDIRVQVITETQTVNDPDNAPPIANIILEGYCDDQRDMDRAVAIATSFVQGNSSQVTNLLEVVNPLQVMVEAHLLEMNRTENSQTGLTWGTREVQGTIDAATGLMTNATLGEVLTNQMNFVENFAFPVQRGPLFLQGNNPEAASLNDIKRLDPFFANLQWQLATGQGKVINNPNVVTRSGEQAEIFVGGESGAVVQGNFGNQQAVFREFGLRMQVTPDVDHKGNINTQVNIELSNPDNTLGATLSGATVPGFRRRTTSNNVTVKDGEHIIVSGLISKEEQKQISKVPLLWKIPVLGRLFQNKRFQNTETELVIIITPHLLASKKLRERFYQDTMGGDEKLQAALGGAQEAGNIRASLDGVPADGNQSMVRQMFAGMQGKSGETRLAGNITLVERPASGAAGSIDPITGGGLDAEPVVAAAEPGDRIRKMLEARRRSGRGAATRRRLQQLEASVPAPAPDPMAPPELPGLVPVRGNITSRIHGILDDSGPQEPMGSYAGSMGSYAPAPAAAPAPSVDDGLDRRVDELFDQIKNKLEGF